MEKKAFPVVPVISTILKVLAVILLILLLAQAVQSFQNTIAGWKGGAASQPFMPPTAPVTKASEKFASLISPFFSLLTGILLPSLVWGAAEMLSMLRRIAINTWSNAGAAPATKATDSPKAE